MLNNDESLAPFGIRLSLFLHHSYRLFRKPEAEAYVVVAFE